MRHAIKFQIISLLSLLFVGLGVFSYIDSHKVLIFSWVLLITPLYFCLKNNRLSKNLFQEKILNNKLLLYKRSSQKLTKILRPALEKKSQYILPSEFDNQDTDYLVCLDSQEESSIEIKSLFNLMKRYFYNLHFKCNYNIVNSIIKVPFSMAFAYQLIFSILDQIDGEICKDTVIDCTVTRSEGRVRVSFVYKADKYLHEIINFQNPVPSHPLFIPNIIHSDVIKKKKSLEIFKSVSDSKNQIDLLVKSVV